MGLMCSWIAVKGAPKVALFDALGLTGTDLPRAVTPGCRQVSFSYLEQPNGWTVVAAEDFDWASRERILELSRLGLTVGCQVEDKVEMTSVATCAENGSELWRVFHNTDPDHDRLDVTGEPPIEFAAIRDSLFQEQAEDAGVDLIHEIPLELLKAVSGFRLDEGPLDAFLALKLIGAEDEEIEQGQLSDRPARADAVVPRAPLPTNWRYSPGFADLAALYPEIDYGPSRDWKDEAREFGRSWVAVKGAPLEAVLGAAGLKIWLPVEKMWPMGQVKQSYLQTPQGWTVVVAKDFKWASRNFIRSLSRLGPTIGVQFEERETVQSIATGAENGAELWRIYNTRRGRPELEVEGSPPPELSAIRDRQLRKQEENDRGRADTDFFYDAPLELAEAICGFHWSQVSLQRDIKPIALKPLGPRDRIPGESVFGSLLELFKKK